MGARHCIAKFLELLKVVGTNGQNPFFPILISHPRLTHSMHRPRNTIAVAKTKQRGRSSAESSGKGLRMGTGRYEWEGGGVSERDGGSGSGETGPAGC